MTTPAMFGEELPEVRQFIREQLRQAAWGVPHTKRALGRAAVQKLWEHEGLSLDALATVRGLAIRGAIALAAEELHRVRVRFRSLPSVSAFYALVVSEPDGRRMFVQAPLLGMSREQVRRVWHRTRRQRDRMEQVTDVLEQLYAMPTWEGAATVREAAARAGSAIEVYVEERPADEGGEAAAVS